MSLFLFHEQKRLSDIWEVPKEKHKRERMVWNITNYFILTILFHSWDKLIIWSLHNCFFSFNTNKIEQGKGGIVVAEDEKGIAINESSILDCKLRAYYNVSNASNKTIVELKDGTLFLSTRCKRCNRWTYADNNCCTEGPMLHRYLIVFIPIQQLNATTT